jgi:hypothetical protein
MEYFENLRAAEDGRVSGEKLFLIIYNINLSFNKLSNCDCNLNCSSLCYHRWKYFSLKII